MERWRQLTSGLLLAALLGALIGPVPGARPARAQEEIPPGDDGGGGDPFAPIPPGGTHLLGADPLRAFTLGGALAAQATVTEVPVEGQVFDYALRVETRARITNENQITLTAQSAAAVSAGDALFIRYYARTIDSAAPDRRGRARFTVRSAAGQEFSRPTFNGTPEEGWKVQVLPVPARLAHAAGAPVATIDFTAPQDPQTVEIGGLEFVNFRRLYLTHQLPYRPGDYEGRAPDAALRAAARERIEKYRKGDLRVVVTDEGGNPIPDAPIRVAMKRHAYDFGTAVSGGALLPATPNDNTLKYRDNLARYFNAGGPENDLKWKNGWTSDGSNTPSPNRQRGINTVRWLRERGMNARGHVLLWPSWGNSPTWLRTEYDATLASQGLEAANAQLRRRILDHVREEAGHPDLRGQLAEWDVINETNANNDFQRILGKGILLEVFGAAREADPGATLYINENSVEFLTSSKVQFYKNEIRYLLDNGAPLGGIGMQGHVGAQSIPSYLANLDSFAEFNLPIKITEFDIVTPDEQLQADYTRDFLTATFSHPATSGFQMWGFWDGAHWLYDAPLFYRGTVPDTLSFNWRLKPSGRAYRDLIFGEWWTDTWGATDGGGEYRTRGFLGDYDITAGKDGVSATASTTLVSEGTVVTIILPAGDEPEEATK